MSFWHPTRALPDLNVSPSGLTRDYTAGETISTNDIVSLHTDGKVYRASSTYPNIVGVALNSASAGGVVRVLVMGVASVVADGAISPGDPVTFSTATAGRAVKYAGHSHTPTLSTASAVTGVSTTTTTVIASVSTTTKSFVSGISVDRRDFTTTSVLSDVTPSTASFVSDIGTDTGYTTDASGYIRHTHGKTTASAVTGITKSTVTAVTGITTTAGTTVVANVTSTTDSAIASVTTTTATVVSGVSTSTGTFVTGVSIGSTLTRVLGVALTGATAAGQTITVLVMPSRI